MTEKQLTCPKCGMEYMIEFENEDGYKCRCIHCLSDVTIWKD